jgi:hypothetical protein
MAEAAEDLPGRASRRDPIRAVAVTRCPRQHLLGSSRVTLIPGPAPVGRLRSIATFMGSSVVRNISTWL